MWLFEKLCRVPVPLLWLMTPVLLAVIYLYVMLRDPKDWCDAGER